MFKLLFVLLTTAMISCVPLLEDTDQSTHDENDNDAFTKFPTIDGQSDELDSTAFRKVPHEQEDIVASTYGTNDLFEKNALMDSKDSADNIANVCSSSLNNDDQILRRQICNTEKRPAIHEPETPGDQHTMHPILPRKYEMKSPPDPQCVNFPSRTRYLTCGGPEGYRSAVDKSYDSFVVLNCIEGMNF